VVTSNLGLIWRHVRRQQLDEIKLPELYLFGLVTHLIMLALMFTLLLEMALHTLRNIGVPNSHLSISQHLARRVRQFSLDDHKIILRQLLQTINPVITRKT